MLIKGSVRPNYSMVWLCYLVVLTLLVLGPACVPLKVSTPNIPPATDVTLTVLHTNDTHSAYGGSTDNGFICYAAQCEGGRGGYLRLDQAVRAVREHKPEAIFLDAGDIFQGTLFWTMHKERMPSTLLDLMGYQAITPGNHEFDEGNDTFLRYIAAVQTPVLAANLNFAPSPVQPGADHLQPYIVLERNGRKIGLVGIVNPDTPILASPDPEAHFGEAKTALEGAIKELKAQGVNIIIAIVHLGLENEKRLAREVNGLDIIVGAHSHSLLSNTLDNAEGPYPVVELTPAGEPVLVVTAHTGCVYLGRLEASFDLQGVLQTWHGEPILLDQAGLQALNAPEPNSKLAELIDNFAAPVLQLLQTRIGFIKSPGLKNERLDAAGAQECRRAECMSGNIVADSLALPFPEAQIVLLNGGSVRSSLPVGEVTPGNVLETLPFQSTPVITKMSGELILQALEHGIWNYGEGEGCFLQVSGMRYAFRPSRVQGSRLTKAEVQDKSGQWQPLDTSADYMVVTTDYVAAGGDGFSMFKNLKWRELDKIMSDVLYSYLEQNSELEIELQGRITVLD